MKYVVLFDAKEEITIERAFGFDHEEVHVSHFDVFDSKAEAIKFAFQVDGFILTGESPTQAIKGIKDVK